ncbi:MAG: hypothetical protein AAGA81_25205, partial [Acidobacteriota bacterium]
MHRLAAYSASLTLLASFALACAGPESIYEARVRRTAYGIAHIEAENLTSRESLAAAGPDRLPHGCRCPAR